MSFETESDSDFVRGVLKIAFGIVLSGIILWACAELYWRYRVAQAVETVEEVLDHVSTEMDRTIKRAREEQEARARAQQELRRREQERRATAAAQERARQRAKAAKEAAWAAFYQPSEECLKTASVECGNAYIRARREFERKYAAEAL